MDQQDNNRAVPGASWQDGQPGPAGGSSPDPKRQPAPVWGGTPDGSQQGAGAEWGDPTSQARTSSEQSPQGQPAQGWAEHVPGSPSAGWGTTPAHGQVPNAGTGWGAPQQYAPGAPSRSGKGNWTGKKGMLVGGMAVVVAAAAGAGAYAAGNGTAASANNGQGAGAAGQFGPGGQSGVTGPGGTTGHGGMTGQGGLTGPGGQSGLDGGPGGLGMGSAGLNAAVHSEYVVLQGSTYLTMAGQAGTVTEISGTSLTVKSDDGFSRTYTVASDVQVTQGMRQRGSGSTGSTLSLSNVTTGASVRVTALKDSDAYTVQAIQLAASGTAAAPGSGTSSN
ncbi:MAG TPA: hypothetical protein VLJ40_09430 [Arthrobacter sp.]|nr:hypothetical protein [Arthrobacter sp.]